MKNLWDIYKPPFWHDRPDGTGYIFDSERNMFADHGGSGDTLRCRGWGRMSYMDLAEARHDACEQRLHALCGHPAVDTIDETVETLNRLWLDETAGLPGGG